MVVILDNFQWGDWYCSNPDSIKNRVFTPDASRNVSNYHASNHKLGNEDFPAGLVKDITDNGEERRLRVKFISTLWAGSDSVSMNIASSENVPSYVISGKNRRIVYHHYPKCKRTLGFTDENWKLPMTDQLEKMGCGSGKSLLYCLMGPEYSGAEPAKDDKQHYSIRQTTARVRVYTYYTLSDRAWENKW